MATEFTLPDLGENIASGDIVSVFVSEGDVVKPGQALLEVETDKAVIEVPCPPGGRVEKVLVKKGETVKVGQPLVLLGAADGAAAPAKPAAQCRRGSPGTGRPASHTTSRSASRSASRREAAACRRRPAAGRRRGGACRAASPPPPRSSRPVRPCGGLPVSSASTSPGFAGVAQPGGSSART